MIIHIRFWNVLLAFTLIGSAIPAMAHGNVKGAIQNLMRSFPGGPSCQGGDRSVFYVRYMNEQTLWNEISYACMIVVEESAHKNDVLITYWPLPKGVNWTKDENEFSTLKNAVCQGNDLSVELTRGSAMKGTSALEWHGVISWGGCYFLVGSNIQKPNGNLDSKYRVYPTPLNHLVIYLLESVVSDGLKQGAFKSGGGR